MKYLMTIFAVLSSALLAASTSLAAEEAQAIRLSEPVEQTADWETFGSPLDETVPVVTLEQLASNGERYEGKPVRVSARIAEVCQKKGCFFIAREGDRYMRVSFRDYGFFVPTDISGRRVVLVGEVVGRMMTAAEAEHYAEDIGGTTLKAGLTYEIVATSVRVPRS